MKFVKFVFLILLFVLGMVAPAKPAQAAPVAQGCGGSYCISVLIWITCGFPGANPPNNDYNGDVMFEIERTSPFMYATDYPSFHSSNGVWDLYQKQIANSVAGTYRVRWREIDNDGWPDPSWSNWAYKTAPAESLTFTFYKYDGVMADGACD